MKRILNALLFTFSNGRDCGDDLCSCEGVSVRGTYHSTGKRERYLPLHSLLQGVLVLVLRLTELVLVDASTQTQHVRHMCLRRLDRLRPPIHSWLLRNFD